MGTIAADAAGMAVPGGTTCVAAGSGTAIGGGGSCVIGTASKTDTSVLTPTDCIVGKELLLSLSEASTAKASGAAAAATILGGCCAYGLKFTSDAGSAIASLWNSERRSKWRVG